MIRYIGASALLIRGVAVVRKICGWLMIVGGLVLIVVSVLDHVWSAVGPAKRMLASFKPVMTSAALSHIRGDLVTVAKGATQLRNGALPAMATEMRLSPTQLQGLLTSHYPSVAAGLAAFPGIIAHFSGMTDLLVAQLGNYRAASTLPVSGVPLTTMPYIFVGLGILGMACGVFVLFRSGSRSAGVPAVALGVIVIVAVLAGSMVPKATSSDHLLTALKPVMTASTVRSADSSLAVVAAMGKQFETGVLPGVASDLHTSPTALGTSLATHFPALGATLVALPSLESTFQGFAGKISANLANYQAAAKIPSLVFLVWLMIGVAAAWIVLGLGAIVGSSSADSSH